MSQVKSMHGSEACVLGQHSNSHNSASSAEYLAAPKDPGFVWTHGAPLDETWQITAQTHMSEDLDYAAVMRDLSGILRETTQKTPGLCSA